MSYPLQTTTEISPTSVEAVRQIAAAGEEVYLDAVSAFPTEYYDISRGAAHPEVVQLADEYESFEQLLAGYEEKVAAGETLPDHDIQAMQTAYDSLRMLRDRAQRTYHQALTEPASPEQATSAASDNQDTLSELTNLVTRYVDQAPHRTPIERQGAHELLRRYKAADEPSQPRLAEQLEQYVNLLGIAPPDTERLKYQAGHVLADIEIQLGWNDELVETARSLYAQITDVVADRPPLLGSADRLIEEKLWQAKLARLFDDLVRLKRDHEHDTPPELVADSVAATEVINHHAAIGHERRRQLQPEDLSQEGHVTIDVSQVRPIVPPAAPPAPQPSPVVTAAASPASAQIVPDAPPVSPRAAASLSDIQPTYERSTVAGALPANLKKAIAAIEQRGVDRLGSWLGETPASVYEKIGNLPFSEFEYMTTLPHAARMDRLDELGLSHKLFQQWDDLSDAMKAAVPDHRHRTFAEVVEQYVSLSNSQPAPIWG